MTITDNRASQLWNDSHARAAGPVNSTAAATSRTTPNGNLPLPPDDLSGQACYDAQRQRAAEVQSSVTPANPATAPTQPLPALADPYLSLRARRVDGAEAERKAAKSGLEQLTRSGPDADGRERGYGLPENSLIVAEQAGYVAGLERLEANAVRDLEKRFRQHPLYGWQRAPARLGVGVKQLARLLAAIGDPYWHALEGRPRSVSELRQYAGHGDPERSRRRRGAKVEHSPAAKDRVYLIAVSCLKAGGPYAEVYRARRAQTAERLHAEPCVRCGPAGSPAQPGSPWSKAHQHADALRILGKRILRDLWREAKRIHELDGTAGQREADAQSARAGRPVSPPVSAAGHRVADTHRSDAGRAAEPNESE